MIYSSYIQHEEENRKKYEQRVIQIEKCSFTPLVYSTTCGMAPKALEFHKRLASLVAEERNERYEYVMGTMRTKLAFSLLKSVLLSLRGHKGKRNYAPATPMSCLSFNLMPGGVKEAWNVRENNISNRRNLAQTIYVKTISFVCYYFLISFFSYYPIYYVDLTGSYILFKLEIKNTVWHQGSLVSSTAAITA